MSVLSAENGRHLVGLSGATVGLTGIGTASYLDAGGVDFDDSILTLPELLDDKWHKASTGVGTGGAGSTRAPSPDASLSEPPGGSSVLAADSATFSEVLVVEARHREDDEEDEGACKATIGARQTDQSQDEGSRCSTAASSSANNGVSSFQASSSLYSNLFPSPPGSSHGLTSRPQTSGQGATLCATLIVPDLPRSDSDDMDVELEASTQETPKLPQAGPPRSFQPVDSTETSVVCSKENDGSSHSTWQATLQCEDPVITLASSAEEDQSLTPSRSADPPTEATSSSSTSPASVATSVSASLSPSSPSPSSPSSSSSSPSPTSSSVPTLPNRPQAPSSPQPAGRSRPISAQSRQPPVRSEAPTTTAQPPLGAEAAIQLQQDSLQPAGAMPEDFPALTVSSSTSTTLTAPREQPGSRWLHGEPSVQVQVNVHLWQQQPGQVPPTTSAPASTSPTPAQRPSEGIPSPVPARPSSAMPPTRSKPVGFTRSAHMWKTIEEGSGAVAPPAVPSTTPPPLPSPSSTASKVDASKPDSVCSSTSKRDEGVSDILNGHGKTIWSDVEFTWHSGLTRGPEDSSAAATTARRILPPGMVDPLEVLLEDALGSTGPGNFVTTDPHHQAAFEIVGTLQPDRKVRSKEHYLEKDYLEKHEQSKAAGTSATASSSAATAAAAAAATTPAASSIAVTARARPPLRQKLRVSEAREAEADIYSHGYDYGSGLEATRLEDLELEERPRASGRNWRGVNRAADTGTSEHGFAIHNQRLEAHGIVVDSQVSKRAFMERYGGKGKSRVNKSQEGVDVSRTSALPPSATDLNFDLEVSQTWAAECSPGPERAIHWGCEPGLSTQYSHCGETWYDCSPTAPRRLKARKDQLGREPPFASNLLPSQRPMPLRYSDEDDEDEVLLSRKERVAEAAAAAANTLHFGTDNPDRAIEAAVMAARTPICGCICGRGACRCRSDKPCMLWPSGKAPRDGNLPPLRGAEGGKATSLGLSLAPPSAQVGMPAWSKKK